MAHYKLKVKKTDFGFRVQLYRKDFLFWWPSYYVDYDPEEANSAIRCAKFWATHHHIRQDRISIDKNLMKMESQRVALITGRSVSKIPEELKPFFC